jgi:predicted transcriptional regulator of viral defense system
MLVLCLVVSDPYANALKLFNRQGGMLRMSDVLSAGISRRTLYAMRDRDIVTQLSRGVYRLASMPELGAPDLVTVSARIPRGVVCLISALSFHELTSQIPHAVDIALVRGASVPRLDYPPVAVHWFSGPAFTSGVLTPVVDGRAIRIYSPEKTLADVFKYRNKLGLDIALEALKLWRARHRGSFEGLLEQARICRVERVIRTYLQAMT